MDQDKSQAKRVDTAGAEAIRGEAGLTAGADRTSATVADRSGPAGEATRPARGTRGGTARPNQAGETMVDPGPAMASTKLDRVVALLRAPGGASLPELQAATGWQVHSVRGAMAGALRRRGYSVTSEKPEDGLRRYRIAEAS
jgi:hypothetical protein